MELSQLEFFVSVVEERGFSRAGERVFRTLWRADHLGPEELVSFLSELQGSRSRAPKAPRRRR